MHKRSAFHSLHVPALRTERMKEDRERMDSIEETKGDLKPVTTQLDQDATNSDLAMTLALQEQENTQDHQLPPNESDDGSYSSSSSVFSYDDEDDYHQFFEELEDEVDGTSQTDLDMDEDDIDPDDMSYEELLALGEIVGEASRGLADEQISSCMEACEWHSSKSETITDRCVVCQMEYEEGEKLMGLIGCAHPYHAGCISQWLQVKKTCPICNTEVSPSVTTS